MFVSVLFTILYNGTIIHSYCSMSTAWRRKPTNILHANQALILILYTLPWCMWIVSARDWSVGEDVESNIMVVLNITTCAQVVVLLSVCLTTDHFSVVCFKLKLFATWLIPFFVVSTTVYYMYIDKGEICSDFRITSIVTFVIVMTFVLECLVIIKYHSSVENIEEASPFKDQETFDINPDGCFVAHTMLFVVTFAPSFLQGLFVGSVVSHWFSVTFYVQTWYGIGYPFIVVDFVPDFGNTKHHLNLWWMV